MAEPKDKSPIAKDTTHFEFNADSDVSSIAAESVISSNNQSMVFEAKKMLVVMIGIGEYNGDAWPRIRGAYRDYCNVKYTFNYKRGYHVIYNKSDNKIEYISNRIKKHKHIKDNFKIRWTKDEIFQFNKSVLKTIANSKSKFDGLIYLLSCHGGTKRGKDVIYDSTGERVQLEKILKQFGNENCAKLRGKPKIAILDFGRGKMIMKKKENSTFVEEKSVEKKNNSNDKPEIGDNNNKKKSNASNNNNNNNSGNSHGNSNNRYVAGGLSDFREIYANLSGYATTDGGLKGNYLIRSFTKIIGSDQLFDSLSLDEMIMQTKKLMKHLLGSGKHSGAAVIDDVNRLTYGVKFLENEENVQSYVSLGSNDEQEFENDSEYESSGLLPTEPNSLAFVATLKNPLVALLCIGKYCKENEYGITFSDITAKSKKDYVNAKYCFNYVLGYSIIYMVGDSSNSNNSSGNSGLSEVNTQIRYLRKAVENSHRVKDNFKLEWNLEEIDNFNKQVKKTLKNAVKNKNEENHDGLIYIISGHGDTDDVLYDSNGEDCLLPFIFEEFNNEECKELRDLPKIFIVDTDRGDEAIKFLIVNNDVNENKNNKNSSDDTKTKDRNNKDIKESKESVSRSNVSNVGRELSAFDKRVLNQRYYCKYSDFRIIYSNVNGYKKIDSIDSRKEKGSYLIRAFTKIVCFNVIGDDNNKKDTNLHTNTLTDILTQTKHGVQKYLKNETKDANQTQIVEETNRMQYFIKFKKRREKK